MSVKVGTSQQFSLPRNIAKSVDASAVRVSSPKTEDEVLRKTNYSGSGRHVDVKTLKNILNKMNNSGMLSEKVQFSFSDKLGELYVKVIDAKTGTVIGQIPSKEMMRLEENMREMIGIIVDKKE